MSTLDEHIPGPRKSIRFFNGRLLTGTDLTTEQQTIYEQDLRRGVAIGAGVVSGLEVTVAPDSTVAAAAVEVTAGRGLAPSGQWLELSTDTRVSLTVPTVTPPAPRTDWRRCDAEASDAPSTTPSSTAPELFVLTLRWNPADSATLARVLQADRANDPCAIDHVLEGVSFRLVRMTAAQALVRAEAVPAARLRNVVAHLCYGSREVPAESSSDAPDTARAIEAMRATEELDACEVPLAVIGWTAAAGITWVDMWAARRRPTPPRTHTALERSTGPRASAEAEARLLQFQVQLEGTTTPTSTAATRRIGVARDTCAFVPPAGALPAAWNTTNAWRHFFGADMVPAQPIQCDAALLPSLLSTVSAEAAIPTVSTGTTVPAVDIYLARREGEAGDVVLAYARSTFGRVLVTVTGITSTSLAASLKIRFTSGDGLRSWDGDRLDDLYSPAPNPALNVWVSPNLRPGTYTVSVVSTTVSSTPTTVTVIGGRVGPASMAVTPIVGDIRVFVEGDKETSVTSILATRTGHATRTATPNGSSWLITGVAIGPWSVQGFGVNRYGTAATEIETAQVSAGARVDVTLRFDVMTEPPDNWVTFPWEGRLKERIKLSMIGTTYTLDTEADAWEVKGFRTTSEERKAAKAGNPTSGKQRKRAGKSTAQGKRVDYIEHESYGGKGQVSQGDTLVDILDGHQSGTWVSWATAPEEVQDWLDAWKAWLVATERNSVTRRAIQKARPSIELPSGKTITQLADTSSAPKQPEVWCVFGPARIPAVVTRSRFQLPTHDYVPDDWRDFMRKVAVVEELPWESIDEAASWPTKYLEELLPRPTVGPDDYYEAAYASIEDRAVQVQENLEYVTGVNAEVLHATGGNLTLLANSSPAMLESLGLSSFQAMVLLDSARSAADTGSWSLTEGGLTHGAALADAGFRSVGDVAGADTGRIAEALGVSEAEAAAVKRDAQGQLVNGVIEEVAAPVKRAAAAAPSEAAEVDLTTISAGTAGVSKEVASAGVRAKERLGVVTSALGETLGLSRLEVPTKITLKQP